MKTMKLIPISFALLGAVVLAFGVTSCGKSNANESGSNDIRNTVAVTVDTVTLREFIATVPVMGVVKAIEDVTISPEEGGTILEWKKEKGDKVRKGDILVQLDDRVMKASYEATLAGYNIAQANFEKQEEVYRQNGISELQYKSLMYQRDAAKANMELMKARLQKLSIASPIDGVVDVRFKNAGELAPPGMPLVRVVNPNRIKVVAEVPEREAARIMPGLAVTVRFDVLGGELVRASVDAVGATVSPTNRTLPIEINIPNPGLRLKPEMFGTVRVITSKKNDAIVIDANLVQQLNEEVSVVFVVVEGKAHQRKVGIGGRSNGNVEILKGLAPGDRLIVRGAESVADGMDVTVQ